MNEFHRLLRRVVDGVERGVLTQQEAAHYVGEHVARRLYCSSASLWAVAGPPGLRVLTRVGGFDATLNMPLSEPLQLTLAGSSTWHDTLSAQRVFASSDVHAEPRLAASHDAVAGLRRVRGLLQAAIGANADLWGFISCSQYDVARLWTLREITQLQRMAVALSIRRSRERVAARARNALPVSPASS